MVASGGNASTYGWNHWYNPRSGQWEPCSLNNGQPPYNAVAFGGMFA